MSDHECNRLGRRLLRSLCAFSVSKPPSSSDVVGGPHPIMVDPAREVLLLFCGKKACKQQHMPQELARGHNISRLLVDPSLALLCSAPPPRKWHKFWGRIQRLPSNPQLPGIAYPPPAPFQNSFFPLRATHVASAAISHRCQTEVGLIVAPREAISLHRTNPWGEGTQNVP